MAIYSQFHKPAFQALSEKKFIKNASFGGQSSGMQRSYRVRDDLANTTTGDESSVSEKDKSPRYKIIYYIKSHGS